MGERRGIWSRKVKSGERDLFGLILHRSGWGSAKEPRLFGWVGTVLVSLWDAPYLEKYRASGWLPLLLFMGGDVVCFPHMRFHMENIKLYVPGEGRINLGQSCSTSNPVCFAHAHARFIYEGNHFTIMICTPNTMPNATEKRSIQY